jgi:hypothetical protein
MALTNRDRSIFGAKVFYYSKRSSFSTGAIIVPIGCAYGRLRQRQRAAKWLLLPVDVNGLAVSIFFGCAGVGAAYRR